MYKPLIRHKNYLKEQKTSLFEVCSVESTLLLVKPSFNIFVFDVLQYFSNLLYLFWNIFTYV